MLGLSGLSQSSAGPAQRGSTSGRAEHRRTMTGRPARPGIDPLESVYRGQQPRQPRPLGDGPSEDYILTSPGEHAPPGLGSTILAGRQHGLLTVRPGRPGMAPLWRITDTGVVCTPGRTGMTPCQNPEPVCPRGTLRPPEMTPARRSWPLSASVCPGRTGMIRCELLPAGLPEPAGPGSPGMARTAR